MVGEGLYCRALAHKRPNSTSGPRCQKSRLLKGSEMRNSSSPSLRKNYRRKQEGGGGSELKDSKGGALRDGKDFRRKPGSWPAGIKERTKKNHGGKDSPRVLEKKASRIRLNRIKGGGVREKHVVERDGDGNYD